ncbi:MAG: hypothetical protein Ct9H300mP25_02160 [Acidobacteriota bacterium]|nr:MAG: hypothetical protein Ct9H300mP25_02160 [Acidobacteriota bacterium]
MAFLSDATKIIESEVIPMLSMMTPRPIGISGPLNQEKRDGSKRESPLANRTQSGNAFVMRVRTVTLDGL